MSQTASTLALATADEEPARHKRGTRAVGTLPPWAAFPLLLPWSVSGTFLMVTMGFFLSNAGVSVAAVALYMSAVMIPDTFKVLYLATAFAQSCNTAFIGQRDRLKDDDLRSAAASLGVGTDYDVGFPASFGSVPSGGNENARAEAVFGQGKDQVSPLAMALAAASVEDGQTVLPTLISGHNPTSTAAPLTDAEAAALKKLMRGVVTEGSGRRLAGLDGPEVIAKTGTAEYGGKTPPKTHAWMIAAQGDLAVAVFVQDGDSGSGTAGPLLEAFLRGAR